MSQYIADNDPVNYAFRLGQDNATKQIVEWLANLDRQTIWHPDTLAERIERGEHLK